MTMEKALMAWLKIGVVLEVLGLAVVALLVVFDVVSTADAQESAIRLTLGIVVLAAAGGIVGGLLASRSGSGSGSSKP